MSKRVSDVTTNFTWNSSGLMYLLMEEGTGSNVTDHVMVLAESRSNRSWSAEPSFSTMTSSAALDC